MAYFIGIDAGGTKTTAALANETTVLARVTAGTIKVSAVGEAAARTVLQKALRDLSRQAGIALTDTAGVCLGLAGRVPEHAAWSALCLRAATGIEPIVVEDVEIAMEAAFRGGPGALVISGTGSQIQARRYDGVSITTGGYGSLLSDEGSGAWIGQQAVRRALAGYDFKTVSPLLAALMQEWQCKTFTDFIAAANPPPLPNFSALVPLVCRLAETGDADSVQILDDAGNELASLIKLAMERLGDNTLPVACTGSILENVPLVREAMITALPGITVLAGVVDPLEGALWLARGLERRLAPRKCLHNSANLITHS